MLFIQTGRGLMASRAWRMCGVAMQSAAAMGLHLRNKGEAVSDISRETRYRLWWALYSLDIQVSLMIGRPPNMSQAYCSTPLPAPYREEDFQDDNVSQYLAEKNKRRNIMPFFTSQESTRPSQRSRQYFENPSHSGTSEGEDNGPFPFPLESVKPNASLYFLCCIGLAFIERQVVDELYSPKAASLSRDELETSIIKLDALADSWLTHLPPAYNFENSPPDLSFPRQRTSLAFRFYSIKLVILEPCLRHVSRMSAEGPCSAHCQSLAHVAGRLLSLLPDKPDTHWLYECGPWWSVLHYLMQGSTILMAGLVGQTEHERAISDIIMGNMKKATEWLNAMSKVDEYPRRAWTVYHELVTSHNPNLMS
ncbi:hypothetical protein N7451_012769 [Penicillium sp. IBT 35674x]|nr:hypothetical protein N7451_012769 [Penicillium sp. IBT 35674x]